MVEASRAPTNWIPVRLGNLGKWLSGGTPRMSNPDYWGGDIPWVSPKDMKRSRLWDSIDHITAKALGNGTRLAPTHALLLVVRGMILAHTFPVARAELPLAFNQDIKVLVPCADVDSEYVLWWLTSNESLLLAITTESTHGTKRMPMDGLRSVEIDLPLIPEQRAIAAALSDVDALLDGLERLIAKKRELKQAAMQQLLTGHTRLPGFHGEWEMKRLGEVAEVRTGPFGSSLHERDYVQDGTPIITVEHLGEFGVEHFNLPLVSDADRRRLQTYSLAEGDIVFSRVGSVDRNALIRLAEAGWLFSGRLLRVRPDRRKAYSPFLSFQFHGEPFKALVRNVAVGQTMASLNTQILAGVCVALPSLREQAAIAAVLSDIDAELSALETRRDKTRALKQGMMQELLTGRIRLVAASSNVVPVDLATIPKHAPSAPKSHNWQFNEAVLVAMLVKQFGSEQYPLGRKRCTKLGYLLHRHIERVTQGYLKKAAGPYNPAVKYKGPETIAQKNGYIRPHTSGKFSGFVAAGRIAEAEGYFDKWYGREVLAWLEQFRHQTNDDLELLATVDMAIVDVKRVHAEANVAAVKSIILDHPEWETKLEREIFSDANIARAISRVTELFTE
jgi:restriction endonuclease S subunit